MRSWAVSWRTSRPSAPSNTEPTSWADQFLYLCLYCRFEFKMTDLVLLSDWKDELWVQEDDREEGSS